MDYRRVTAESGNSVWSMAAHLRDWCIGDLCYEANEEVSNFAVFSMCCSIRCCGVCHWICIHIFFWNASMGLSGAVVEHSWNHLFSQCDKFCYYGYCVPLCAGTKSGTRGQKDKLENNLSSMFGDIHFVCSRLYTECVGSDTNYILDCVDKTLLEYDRNARMKRHICLLSGGGEGFNSKA